MVGMQGEAGTEDAEKKGNRRGASKKLRTVMIKPRDRETPSRERKDIHTVTRGGRDTGRAATQEKTAKKTRDRDWVVWTWKGGGLEGVYPGPQFCDLLDISGYKR